MPHVGGGTYRAQKKATGASEVFSQAVESDPAGIRTWVLVLNF